MVSFKETLEKSHPYLKGVEYFRNTPLLPKLLVSPYASGSYEDNEWHQGFFDARFMEYLCSK